MQLKKDVRMKDYKLDKLTAFSLRLKMVIHFFFSFLKISVAVLVEYECKIIGLSGTIDLKPIYFTPNYILGFTKEGRGSFYGHKAA